MKKTIQERLQEIPISEKAKMMFLRKKKEQLLEEINLIFKQINNLNSNKIYNKSTTALLKKIQQYLESDHKYIFTKFTKEEYYFYKKIKYLNTIEISTIKKYLPFLESQSEKTNRILINSIGNLFEQKKTYIESFYEKDILIINGFLKYTNFKLKSGGIFYYEPDEKNSSWTKKEFTYNLFNFFSYKIRTNPISLTEKYIENMKLHFSFLGHGLQDRNKTDLGNHYFKTNSNPFDIGNDIPEQYREVKIFIISALYTMVENEKILQKIVDDVIEKYKI